MKFGDMLVVIVVIFILFGVKRLPELAKGVGAGIKGFKTGIRGEKTENTQE